MVTIADVLNQWEAIGVFDLLLPFLLIFSVTYAILSAQNIVSSQKGINLVISLVIGLLALRLGFVQDFFREAFPRLGVGLAAFLIVLIMLGAFVNEKYKGLIFWIFFAIGAVIAIIVLAGTFGATTFGLGSGFFDSALIIWVVSIAVLIGVIVVIATSGGDNKNTSTTQGTDQLVALRVPSST